FDQAGKIIDCIGTIKDGGNIEHDYAGSGLARFVRDGTPPIHNSTNQAPRYCSFRTARVNNGCASRVGLTPSPTCLPGQGGSRKGMRPFGNETGHAIVSPPRSNRWRVFYVGHIEAYP